MNSPIQQGQSFLDKVLEATGSIDNCFEMAVLNNMSITDELIRGSVLQASPVTNRRAVAEWNKNNLPATALSNIEFTLVVPDDGIGAMIIGETFIVG